MNRFSPIKLAHGHVLRNRVVIPPMASQTADEQGFVTEKTLEHYQRLSQAGAGLLFVEYTFVHSTGRSEDFQLGIQSDRHIEGLNQLALNIQKSGALAGIQITHAGGKTDRSLAGGELMGPSEVAVPVKDQQLDLPRAMTAADILLWKSAFASAVDRAAIAGFDVVEFHAAHGYGLNQWLSPITNRRTDGYGGDHSGRMKILLEIVSEARAKHPALGISVRMPGQDFFEGGLTIGDSIQIATELEKIGVDLIHVSSGIGGWRRPGSRVGEGYLVAEAAQIQATIKVPVIGVGGIETGRFIDEGLNAQRFALASVGRAILKDPESWGRKNLHGRKKESEKEGEPSCATG